MGGVESVTLTAQQIPSHGHAWLASTGGGTSNTPQGNVPAAPPVTKLYIEPAPPPTRWRPTWSSRPAARSRTTIFMPYIAINYIISLFGIFPSPS